MDYPILLKLVLAALLGGMIGVEREMHEKPAGLRTNILICVGSTLFMIISLELGKVFGDHTRIAAQIITGIGFLGAGAVLHSHGFVLGLTTAATIWVVAGVGMAIGSGFYSTAVLATLLSIATLTVMAYVEERLQGHRVYSYALTVTDFDAALSFLKNTLKEMTVSLPSFNFRRNPTNYKIWFNVVASREVNVKIVERLSKSPEIIQLETGTSAQDFTHPLRPHGE